ncbi:hypothetical protein MD484_g9116, partial [Candolleomyces efflorescens]
MMANDGKWDGVSEDKDAVLSGAKGSIIGKNLGRKAWEDLSESSDEQSQIKLPEFDKRSSSKDDSDSQTESLADEEDPVSKITLLVPPSPVAKFLHDVDFVFLRDLGVQDEVSVGEKRQRANSKPRLDMGSTEAESDNGSDVDKTSQMSEFKVGPPRKKKKNSAKGNACPTSHPPPESPPQDSPAKNTRQDP